MSILFDAPKLMEYTPLFFSVKAAVAGAGAVGSYLAEFLAKLGVGHITLIDFDSFTLKNAAKHSGIIRTPEDAGRSKALAVAERVQPLMVSGGSANGMNAEICRFGPMAFAGYDAVFLALDNFAAKLYFNQIWLQIPRESRPLLIYGGTLGEMAQANCLDGSGPCLRCLVDESWLADQTVQTSCTGVQYRYDAGEPVVVRTSGLASAHAALLMAEQLRAAVLCHNTVPDTPTAFPGCHDLAEIVNKRLCYTAYPTLSLTSTTPLRRNSCPDCRKRAAPPPVTALEGSVTTLSMTSALEQIAELLGTRDFGLKTHVLEYAGVGYGRVLKRDYCRCCGAVLEDLYVHEGLSRSEDIICPSCREAGRSIDRTLDLPTAETVRSFSPDSCPEAAGAKTLFDLGWPIGAYLYVLRKAPGSDLLGSDYEQYCFTCAGDQTLMMTETLS